MSWQRRQGGWDYVGYGGFALARVIERKYGPGAVLRGEAWYYVEGQSFHTSLEDAKAEAETRVRRKARGKSPIAAGVRRKNLFLP